MVTKLSHTSLFVSDQDKAYDFYVNKLGFKAHTDAKMENGFRWLTVTAPDAPEHEIVLFPALAAENGFEQNVRDALKLLLDKCSPFLKIANSLSNFKQAVSGNLSSSLSALAIM